MTDLNQTFRVTFGYTVHLQVRNLGVNPTLSQLTDISKHKNVSNSVYFTYIDLKCCVGVAERGKELTTLQYGLIISLHKMILV